MSSREGNGCERETREVRPHLGHLWLSFSSAEQGSCPLICCLSKSSAHFLFSILTSLNPNRSVEPMVWCAGCRVHSMGSVRAKCRRGPLWLVMPACLCRWRTEWTMDQTLALHQASDCHLVFVILLSGYNLGLGVASPFTELMDDCGPASPSQGLLMAGQG